MEATLHDSPATLVSDAEDLGKTQTGLNNNGLRMRQMPMVKIGDLRQITRYNSKNVDCRKRCQLSSVARLSH